MKIKILTSCAGPKFSFRAGVVADVDDATAKDLIRAGHAKEAKADGKGNNSAVGGAGKSG